jgi:large subunit ribosomal protein L9
MKIILNADLDNLGRKGDVIEVKGGYARNFLLPRNLAVLATKGALREAENVRKVREERNQREVSSAQETAERISSTPLKISARAGEDGHLFGSITSAEIAERLTESLGTEFDRRKIHLQDSIRSLGVHEFEVRLHPEVVARGSIEIAAES